MVTYHIYFTNKYSRGGLSQDYTLWRKSPSVNSGPVEEKAFSNAFLTRNVTSNGIWSIDINDIPYAFCGTSSRRPLSLGEIPDVTGQKLVKVLPNENGSTVSVYNNQGRPAFRPGAQYTASPGTYQISTEAGFTPNLNFVAGHSGNDGDGVSRPFATFEIDQIATYSVQPSACFYLGDFHSSPGALVDSSLAPNFAKIDFDAYPGQTNAVVTQDAGGKFDVKIVTAAVFAMTVASTESTTSSANAQLTQLKSQAKILNDLIDAALGISTTVVSIGSFKCTLQWRNNPSFFEKSFISAILNRAMAVAGYDVKESSIDPMSIVVWHTPDLTLGQVFLDWARCILALSPALQEFVMSPNVIRLLLGSAIAAQSEALSFPADFILPRPQWSCSLKWLEGPPKHTKVEIGAQLAHFMYQHGYLTWPPKITDESVTLEVYRYGTSDIKSVLADWQAAYRSLGFLGMFVTDPQVERIFRTQDGTQAQSNGIIQDGISTTIFPPPIPSFVGTLDWLEGPNEETRKSITDQIVNGLRVRGCTPESAKDNGTTLELLFSHAPPYELSQAKEAWDAACKDVNPSQRMYFFNKGCEMAEQIQGNKVSVDVFPPLDPTYNGILTWLEGAPPQTRDAIVIILADELRKNGNSPVSVDKTSPKLSLFFSHKKPSDLQTATKHWMSAYDAVKGNLRMFITDPKCEDVYTIQESNETTSKRFVLPVVTSYIGALNWLEGANEETKNSIIGQLTATLKQRGNGIGRITDFTAMDMLFIGFTGSNYDLERATADWLAAFNSVNEFQRMFITNPRCTVDEAVHTTDISISDGYIGCLTWLEGPGKLVRDSIIGQLRDHLEKSGYNTEKGINFPDFLALPFSHIKPSSFEQAKADWLAAFNSIQGNQRMYITDPFCEEDSPVHIPEPNVTTNATNGAEVPPGAAAAPEGVPEREEETLESKKKRALALLEREGLVGFGSAIGLT